MTSAVDPSITTGPIADSTKIYRAGVPLRRVQMSNGEHLALCDTSGPYTDPDAVIDLTAGLRRRRDVVRERGTQLPRARAGQITAELARDEFVRGRALSPANHPESEPTLTVKRVTGIVSRGGSIMSAWCLVHRRSWRRNAVARQDAAGRAGEDRTLLFDVRTQILFDAHLPRRSPIEVAQ